MDALATLQDLYRLRDQTIDKISQIESILGAEPGEVKTRKPRGPNKPKGEMPTNTM